MPHLSYTTAAVDDLRAIADFIAQSSGSEDVAEAFVMQLDGRCQRLAALPGNFALTCARSRTKPMSSSFAMQGMWSRLSISSMPAVM
jgi:plasmid stabilization system protein ParE